MTFAATAPAIAFSLALACAAPVAAAISIAAPEGVVTLSSSASIEITKDLLTIAFNTTREGADAGTVQSQLKQALDAALVEARKAARPGQLEVRTGNFSLTPRYTNKGVPGGWQGSAELIVEGRDLQAISQLSGRITTLTIGRVAYDLSRELREKSEADVSAQAIARYRAKAADYAKQFGYAGYAIGEVNVNTNEAPPGRPIQLLMRSSASAPADEALPVEAGKGTVTVNVSGTVHLTR